MPLIIDKLMKSFGDQKAVDNVSFSIKENEIVGFLGPNGAGKSTIMRIITGILSADQGKVFIDNEEVTTDNTSYKSKIGYLPEHNPLYLDMYVREYLQHIASIYKIKNKRSRIEEVINMCQLGTEAHKTINLLSKGYRQRVGLAQALLHDPEILILDEPMTGLDPNQLLEIRELIRNVGKNKIVLFSSHIMQEVEAVCDRVLILKKGQLVSDSSPKNITQNTKIEIRFEKPINIDLLNKIDNIQVVESKANNIYCVEAEQSPENVGKSLFEFAKENNYTILHMIPKKQSLEGYFTSITK